MAKLFFHNDRKIEKIEMYTKLSIEEWNFKQKFGENFILT